MVFLDALQPQLASHICTTCNGYFPTPNMSSLFIEISPGMDVHKYVDISLKNTNVYPGALVVERSYGMFELHHYDKGDVLESRDIILHNMNKQLSDRIKPKIITNTIIRSIEPMHAMIINKLRFGSMIKPGESLYIMEVEPAAYIALAANEAEKSVNINLIEIRTFGAFGRLYLSGIEANIDEACKASMLIFDNLL